MNFVGEGVGEGDQCRGAEVGRCFLSMGARVRRCGGELSLAPLLLCPLAPLLPCPPAPLPPEGAVEQGDEASIFADVGQALNVNTVPRRGEEPQRLAAGGEVEDAGHPQEDGGPALYQA